MWYGAFKGANLSQIRDGWEAILYPHGQSWAPSSTVNTKVLFWLDLLFTLFLVSARLYSSYSSLPLDVCFHGGASPLDTLSPSSSEKQRGSRSPVRCTFNAELFTQIKISDGKCCETVDLMDVPSAGAAAAAAARSSGTPWGNCIGLGTKCPRGLGGDNLIWLVEGSCDLTTIAISSTGFLWKGLDIVHVSAAITSI